MNISEQIIEVIETLCDKFGIAIDWTSNNILPYVEQLCKKFILWETSTSVAWIVIAGIFFITTLVITIIVDWDGIEWFIFGAVAFVTLVTIGIQVFDIIECNTFPEKAIYDYIQYQLNNAT